MKYSLLVLIFLLIPLAQAQISTSIQTNLDSGPSPLAVSFDGFSGVSPGNANNFTDLYYEWDFDDPTCNIGNCTWEYTGKSRNKMTGPIAAHVFEPTSFPQCGGTCKIFNVTLSVTNPSGNTTTANKQITVYDPNSTGNGWGDNGETICISKSGSFNDCPLACGSGQGHAECVTSSDTVNSLLNTYVNSNRRILFLAGESWNMPNDYDFSNSHNGPSLIGSYGNGKATINVTGGDTTIERFGLAPDGWVFQDLFFTGSVGPCPGTQNLGCNLYSGLAQVKNLLIQRTEHDTSFEAGGNGVITLANNGLPNGPDSGLHSDIFLVDNNWPKKAGGKYALYISSFGLYVFGNHFGDNARFAGGKNIIFSNNLMPTDEAGAGAIQFRDHALNNGACADGCTPNQNCKPGCGSPNQYMLVQDNEFVIGGPTSGGVSCCMQGDGWEGLGNLPAYDLILERNYFHPPSWGFEPESGWSTHVSMTDTLIDRFTIRNNIFDTTGMNLNMGTDAPGAIWTSNAAFDIYNNVCYRSDSGTNANCMRSFNNPGECRNNVFYAPGFSNNMWDSTSTNCSGGESNNYDDGAKGNLTSNPFTTDNPSNVEEFKLKEGSQLIDAGIAVSKVFDDFGINSRPQDSGYEVGAWEYGEATPECTIASDCADLECNTKSCSAGNCVYNPVSSGTPCNGGICDTSGNCISASCPESTLGSWNSTEFTPQTGTFTVEFDAIPGSSDMDGITGLSNGDATGYSDSFVTVWFNWDGEIEAWDNTANNPFSANPGWYSSDNNITYTAGNTYHFKIVVDVPSETFSAYVTPPGKGEQIIGTNRTFRDNLPAPDQFDHWHMYAGGGINSSTATHEVCNFTLSTVPTNQGDLNGDGIVDIFDIVIVGKTFNKTYVDPGFDSRADLTGDLRVDIVDLTIIAQNLGN